MKFKSGKKCVLTILLILLATNSMDGVALGLVAQNIKVDLHLSDSQLGLLSGIAFTLLYAIAGIPIARWADRGNRVTIISLSATAWSVLVALCGFASSFGQLLLIRIGVGVGEAGLVPAAHSLIADYFTRAERPRAVSTFLQGNSLSIVIGYFVAGWLNELYGWRATFMMLGLLGLVPAALALLALVEPRRAKPSGDAVIQLATESTYQSAGVSLPVPQPSIREVTATLWRNRTFRHLLYCFSVVYFFSSGIAQWIPAFFIRSYGLKTGELGTWLALIYGIGGMVGLYAGGAWASRRAANSEHLQLRAMAIAYCAYGILNILVYLSPNRYLAFGLIGLASIVGTLTTGPLFATIQTLIPQRMRAMSIATVYLSANLIGLGLGPLAAGALSDALRPLLGEESLRFALLALCPGFVWVAWHLWRASTTVARDIEGTRCAEQDTAANVGRTP